MRQVDVQRRKHKGGPQGQVDIHDRRRGVYKGSGRWAMKTGCEINAVEGWVSGMGSQRSQLICQGLDKQVRDPHIASDCPMGRSESRWRQEGMGKAHIEKMIDGSDEEQENLLERMAEEEEGWVYRALPMLAVMIWTFQSFDFSENIYVSFVDSHGQ